jgi:hypothetical protein
MNEYWIRSTHRLSSLAPLTWAQSDEATFRNMIFQTNKILKISTEFLISKANHKILFKFQNFYQINTA